MTPDLPPLPIEVTARVHCLRLALERRAAGTTAAELVAVAKTFEAYVLGGTSLPAPVEPTSAGPAAADPAPQGAAIAAGGRNAGQALRRAPAARA
jgi:hypothetical protein